MLDELMEEYKERFGEVFPLMCCMDMRKEDIAKEVKACLDRGEPFKLMDDVRY